VPRLVKPAETSALILGLAAVFGSLALALVVPASSTLPAAIYLLWIVALAAALNLNIAIDSIELNFAGFFVLSAFLALGTGAALGILIASLLLSEGLSWVLRQLRHDPPRGVWTAVVSISNNLALEGWGLLLGSLVYYALGGSIPLTPPASNWIIDLSLKALLPLIALDVTYFVASFGVGAWLVRLQGVAVPNFAGRHWREITIISIVPTLLSFTLAVAALNIPVGAFAGTCAMLILSMAIAHNLSNARLRLERRIRELDSLAAIGQAVANSLELPEVLEAIHQQTLRLMDARHFYIALYDETERRITFPLAYENNERVTYTNRLFGEGFTEYMILTRQPLLIKHDVRAFAEQIGHTSFDQQVQSWLGVPIAIGERVLGVLAVQSRERANVYDESHRDILISIAAQAATAIRNSQMYMDLRHQTSNLFIMNSVLTVINATLKLDEILNVIVTSLARVMDCQKVAIFLADDQAHTAQLAASHNLSANFVAQARAIPIGSDERTTVIATGHPLIVSDTDSADRLAWLRATSESEGFRALAEVPLWTQHQVIGALTVYYAEPHAFTPTAIEELTAFANQAAVAVANARLYARTDQALARRIEQLATLQQIGLDLVSSLDLQQVMQRLLERAAAAANAQQGTVGIWDEEQGVVRVSVTHGYTPDETTRLLQTHWPLTSGVVGRAFRTRQSFFLTDVRLDPDYVVVTPETRSEMVVLLKKEDRILGVINLESPEVGRFDQTALDFIMQLATQTVIALENAQLYQSAQSRLREMSILYEVGQQLTSILDLPQLGEELTRLMARALNTTYCGLRMFESAVDTLHTIGKYLSPEIEHAPAVLSIATDYALADHPNLQTAIDRHDIQITYRADAAPLSPDQAMLHQVGLHAVLNMPLLLGQELIGVVEWGDERPGRRFTTAEIQFAQTLGHQATIAVHNARLFEERTRRINNLSQLYQASVMLTTSVELEQVLNNSGAVAREITNADSVALYLYDASTASFTRVYAQGFASDDTAAPILRHNGMTRRVIEQGQPLFVRDTQAEPDLNPAALASGIRSLIAAPLMRQGKPIGVLYVHSVTPQQFDADDMQLVSALANQAAVAIENAQLFEERARRIFNLNELYQASLALSTSIELEEVLRRISTVAREISRADAVTLYVYDKIADSFTRAYALGVTGDWSPAHLRSTGMTRRVVKEGVPILVTETHGHPEVNPHTIEAGIRSLIAVPLISQGQTVGVMYVGSFTARRFDQGDVQFVSSLANQAAVAISNARLFSEIAESRDQLQAILDSADDGLLIFEPTGRIVLVNPRLEVMWDMPHGWLNERQLHDLLAQPEVAIAEKLGYTPEMLQRLLNQIGAGNTPTGNRHVYALPGQVPPRYVERACLPVLDGERQPIGWMMVLRDVTEELELQRMRDDLTNTIVHDLRSPLSSILGSLYFIEELVEDQDPASPTREALTISIRGANKLMNLVNSLLDIARLSAGQALVELHPQRLEMILDAAVEYLLPLAGDGEITLSKIVEPDLPLVLVDEDKINRVIVNLIDNALKFTPRGGQVTVSAERWLNSDDGSYVRCIVRDTGPGIPPEYRSRIFERFVQISNRQGRRRGTGIGLNFCQLAVEAHGGRIWVDEAPGGGSEFSFTVQAVAD
jgi:NtrC-family two-component system sensor histidine kinase KinB